MGVIARLYLCIFLSMFALSACGEPKGPVSTAVSKQTTVIEHSIADVLVSTDIEPLSNFTPLSTTNNATCSLLGQYFGEFGGATIEVTVSGLQHQLLVSRLYREPGLSPFEKTFRNVDCVAGNSATSNEIEIWAVENGLLLLEKSPELELISNELWYFLNKR